MVMMKCPSCGHEWNTDMRHHHNWKLVGEARCIDWDESKHVHFMGEPRPIEGCNCGRFRWKTFCLENGRVYSEQININYKGHPFPKYVYNQLKKV